MSIQSTMTLREVRKQLQFAAKYKKSSIMFGDSGVGKSEVVRQFAKEYAPNSKVPYVEVNLGQRTSTDVNGLYVPVDVMGVLQMKMAIPDFWLPLFDPNYKGVLFLDEINHADATMQSTVYTLLQDRMICGKKLSEGVVIVAAGNFAKNGGKANTLLKPVINRCLLMSVESNTEKALKVWLEDYAYGNNIHTSVVSFLEKNPSKLNTNNVDNQPNMPFCSQRAYGGSGGVSDVMYELDSGFFTESEAFTTLAGLIGDHNASDLMKEYRYGAALPNPINPLDGTTAHIHLDKNNVNSPIANYIIGSIVTAWSSRFANKEYTDEQLGKQIDNAFAWMCETFGEAVGSELKDAIIAAGNKLSKFVGENGAQYGRERAKLYFINNTQVFKNVTKFYMEIQKQLAA